MATFVAVSLGAIESLESNSETYLDATGSQIGEARSPRDVVGNEDLGTPPGWALPTTPPTSASTSSSSSSSSTSTSTTSTTTTSSSSSSSSTTSTTASTSTTTPYPPGTPYTSVNVGLWNGGCVSIGGGGGNPWWYVNRTSNCDAGSGQQSISSTLNADGSMTLLSDEYGTCFQPWNGNNDNWVDTTACTGADNQKWIEIPAANGQIMYQNVETGYCLNLNGPQGYAVQSTCNDPGDPGSQGYTI